MQSVTQWIWWTGSTLLGTLILRMAFCRLYKRYPFFFAYLCVVVANTILATLLFGHAAAYVRFYWAWSQPSSILAFTLVLWEAQKRTFWQAPGFVRILRFLLPAAFGVLLLHVASAAWSGSFRLFVEAMTAFEQSARHLQAGYLAVLFLFALYYRIQILPQVKGILAGVSLVTAAGVICLAGVAYAGARFHPVWTIIQPVAFCLAVGIWIGSLWRRDERVSTPGTASAGEAYLEIRSRTARAHSKLSNVLLQVLRSNL